MWCKKRLPRVGDVVALQDEGFVGKMARPVAREESFGVVISVRGEDVTLMGSERGQRMNYMMERKGRTWWVWRE